MAPRTLKPFFVVLGLMAATSLALALTVDVNLVDQPGVKVLFPSQLGRWNGDAIVFCQNKDCGAQFYSSEITNAVVCPKCGGKLSGLSKVEADLLPPDTEGIKERYRSPDGHTVMTSIVLSGKERASIHRPETCLRGQGSDITGSQILDVPITGRQGPLKVKVLLLTHERAGPGGTKESYGTYYAYWFAGKGRETPQHWQRMIWMATDRIFHSVAHRWAYIAISGVRTKDGNEYQSEVREVIGLLYPQIVLK